MRTSASHLTRLGAFLLAAVWTAPLSAQTLFPIEKELSTSPAADSVVVGDLDGDGVNDLLLTSAFEASVKWMRGLGSGDFANPIDLDLFRSNLRVQQIVDLDSDGLPDILFFNTSDPSFVHYRWARQLPNLEFEVTGVLSFPRDTSLPILTDLGGSGAGNFAIVQERRQVGAEVYRWNGAAFNASPIVIPIPGVRDLRLLDINDDGRDEIAAFSSTAQTWRNSSYLGGDQFSVPRAFLPTEVVRSPGIRLGDLDGDGDSDLVALAENDDQKFFVYERLTPTTFGPPTEFFTAGILAAEPSFDLVDFDGDGLLDIQASVGITTTSTTFFRLHWIRNLGALDFATSQPLAPDRLGEVLEDFTGDGTPEGRTGTSLVEYLQGGGVSPDPWYSTTLTVGRPLPGIRRAFPADVDGDGDLDIVKVQFDDEQSVFENLGGLNFAEFRSQQPLIPEVPIVLDADFVGDAQIDRLRGGRNQALTIERGLSPGIFAPPVVISSALQGQPFAVDADGDGDLDVLQEEAFPPTTRVWLIENSGIGNQFPRRIVVDLAQGLRRAVPIDVDSDGLPDLVTQDDTIAGPGVRLNLGGGNFGPPARLSTSFPTDFIVTDVVDFNADGRVDLLVRSSGSSGSLRWVEKLGPLDFAPSRVLADGFLSPRLDDLDGDGLLDVIAGNSYRLQTSPGILGSFERIAPGLPAPRPDGLADFDGDGDLDAWVSVLGPAVYLVENIATPSVGGPAEVCAAAGPNSTGLSGELRAYGSDSVMSTDLRLSAVQLPPAQFGFFVGSREVGPPLAVPGSAGSICLRGSIGRYVGTGQIQSSSAAGVFSIDLDPMNLLVGAGPVAAMANETWFFQAWHRDADAGGAPTSQFTNALAIVFTP